MMRWNVDLFVAHASPAMAVGALVAVAIGLPALRIRGLYLAVTTHRLRRRPRLVLPQPGQLLELRARQHRPRRCSASASTWRASGSRYYFCLAVAGRSPSLRRAGRLRRSRAGRVMIGTRDNERAADALGRADDAGEAADVRALRRPRRPGRRALRARARAGRRRARARSRPAMSIEVFSFAVIGGLGSVAGAMSGVVLLPAPRLRAGQERSTATSATILRLSLSGAGLLFILYFLPGGLWQFVQRLRDRYLRWVADRRGLLGAEPRGRQAGRRSRTTDPTTTTPRTRPSVIAGALS